MAYTLRTCYVNFAEHLQNAWNVNFIYQDAPGTWSEADWKAFFKEIRTFGYTNFQFWIPPTLVVPGKQRDAAAVQFQNIMKYCHAEGLTANPMLAVNTIGAEWYFACPNCKEDRARIMEFWQFYADRLRDADIFTIFPGDPGGCNRNGCDHNTFLTLAAELAHMLKQNMPHVTVEVGTWGTPFTGWGDDMRRVPDWDGTWNMLTNPETVTPEVPCHIWNGTPERAAQCMEDFLKQLHIFPKDTMFSINSGFNPDCEPTEGYDGRPLIQKVSETHRVNSWDYSASEGELVCYPHFRVGKYQRKRKLELDAAPLHGAICYTMSPKLNQLMLYSAAQLMQYPDKDPYEIAGDFTEQVFADRKIGELMDAFEIVPGWGYEPTPHDKETLIKRLSELVLRLQQAEGAKSALPLFPSPEEYRETLLWHAENFLYLLSDSPDRSAIRKEYWNRALSVYDTIPKAVDERSELAADQYSNIGSDIQS